MQGQTFGQLLYKLYEKDLFSNKAGAVRLLWICIEFYSLIHSFPSTDLYTSFQYLVETLKEKPCWGDGILDDGMWFLYFTQLYYQSFLYCIFRRNKGGFV